MAADMASLKRSHEPSWGELSSTSITRHQISIWGRFSETVSAELYG
jgi:hypothetical protein